LNRLPNIDLQAVVLIQQLMVLMLVINLLPHLVWDNVMLLFQHILKI
jgi:hypothetical protein